MAGKEVDNTHYDVIFNAQSFTCDEMADAIINLMRIKQLIEDE
jgi:hypothetical protein